MMTLTGKVAIVTGASSGIGRATAKLFAQQGAKVIVSARRQHELDSLVAEITAAGGEATALSGDVTNESYAKALVELAEREYGGLDVAFNNAGILGASGSTTDITLEAWNHTINTNLSSAFLGAKYQIPAMLKTGVRLFLLHHLLVTPSASPKKLHMLQAKPALLALLRLLLQNMEPMLFG